MRARQTRSSVMRIIGGTVGALLLSACAYPRSDLIATNLGGNAIDKILRTVGSLTEKFVEQDIREFLVRSGLAGDPGRLKAYLAEIGSVCTESGKRVICEYDRYSTERAVPGADGKNPWIMRRSWNVQVQQDNPSRSGPSLTVRVRRTDDYRPER